MEQSHADSVIEEEKYEPTLQLEEVSFENGLKSDDNHMDNEQAGRDAIQNLDHGYLVNGHTEAAVSKKEPATPTTKIFIGNLSEKTKPEKIRQIFSRFGVVVECDIIKNYGFVHMENEQAGQDAIKNLNGYLVHGQPMKVEVAVSNKDPVTRTTKIFIGNLSKKTTPEYIYQIFSRFGVVVECDIIKKDKKKFGFVHMENEQACRDAIQNLDGYLVHHGQPMKVEAALSNNKDPVTPTTKIFIGNLSKKTTPEKIRQIFSSFGVVVRCNIIQNNFGFVYMENEQAVREAIQNLDGYLVHGRPVKVEAIVSKKGPATPTTKIFIGNLSKKTTPEYICQIFSKFGVVVVCDIIKNYGFVHLESTEGLKEVVMALNGEIVNGQPMKVQIFTSKIRTRPGMDYSDHCYCCGRKDHWSKRCPKLGRGCDRGHDDRDGYRDVPMYMTHRREPLMIPPYMMGWFPPPPARYYMGCEMRGQGPGPIWCPEYMTFPPYMLPPRLCGPRPLRNMPQHPPLSFMCAAPMLRDTRSRRFAEPLFFGGPAPDRGLNPPRRFARKRPSFT